MSELVFVSLVAVFSIVILLFGLFSWQSRKKLDEQIWRNQELLRAINENISDKFVDFSRDFLTSNSNIDLKLNSNLKNINSNFTLMAEKISRLDALSELNLSLKDELVRLNKLFSNPKHFGAIGEFECQKILNFIYGDDRRFYSTQQRLPNGTIADFALIVSKEKLLCIDSKFPLIAYSKILNTEDKKEQEDAKKALFATIRKQIKDVSDKYIIESVTLNYALIFIPSEAIYSYICSKDEEIYSYCFRHRVFLASPMTFSNIIYTQKSVRGTELMAKNIKEVKGQLHNLSVLFDGFIKNSNEIARYATRLNDAIVLQQKSATKIKESFEKIEKL